MNKKILIAEDDRFLANAYRIKFEKSGFEVQIAYDGKEALEILDGFLPEIILMDLIMPIMDGFGLITALKAETKYKNIPVIVSSNLSQKEDFDKAKELGAIDFFVKSDTPIGEIVQKVERLLNKQ